MEGGWTGGRRACPPQSHDDEGGGGGGGVTLAHPKPQSIGVHYLGMCVYSAVQGLYHPANNHDGVGMWMHAVEFAGIRKMRNEELLSINLRNLRILKFKT